MNDFARILTKKCHNDTEWRLNGLCDYHYRTNDAKFRKILEIYSWSGHGMTSDAIDTLGFNKSVRDFGRIYSFNQPFPNLKAIDHST